MIALTIYLGVGLLLTLIVLYGLSNQYGGYQQSVEHVSNQLHGELASWHITMVAILLPFSITLLWPYLLYRVTIDLT